MSCILVVIRHAKSDWEVPVPDRERPLSARGRSQAPATGTWLAAHVPDIELALVSEATRTRQTWDLVRAELPGEPTTRIERAAYTFDGDELLDLVRRLPADVHTAAIVSHNPAVEELVGFLTGEWVPMPTSALAVIELPSWRVRGSLVEAGRPADGRGSLRRR